MGNEYGIYPLTVFQCRYNGCYSGGVWLAFMLHPHEINEDAVGCDNECQDYFHQLNTMKPRMTAHEGHLGPYGRADTIEGAIADLKRRLDEIGLKYN